MQLNIFSQRLKELMELDGYSIRALSKKIGVDRRSVRLWLNGIFYPKSEVIIKLSLLFKVSIDYLVGMENTIDNENFVLSINVPLIKEIQNNFSHNLSVFLQEKKMTLYALSKKLKVDQKAITKWITHGSMPEVATLIKLANLINISINELLGMV